MTTSAVLDPIRPDADRTPDQHARFEDEAGPYLRLMFPAALRLTNDRHDAEDLLQETFTKAYVKFHQYTPGTNLRAWLHSIMYSIFYSNYRKQRRQVPELLAGDVTATTDARADLVSQPRSAESEALENLGDSGIMRALAELPDKFKTVVYLADVQGYRYTEIADILRVPLGTVMSRIHRGRQALRRKLTGPATARAAIV